MGKSPGRSLVALMTGRGARPTRLYDSRIAPDKRQPSPAQLAAIRKATVEHQVRAAERHGVTRAELAEPIDPTPGWEHTPTPKEGNPMSDNKLAKAAELVVSSQFGTAAPQHGHGGIPDTELFEQVQATYGPAVDSTLDMHLRADELERAVWAAGEVGAEDEQLRAEHALAEHLREYRVELSNDPHWTEHYADIDRADNPAVAPHGHNQRIAFLLATVAANQARVDDAALAQNIDNARAEGEDAVEALRARYSEDQAAAEARMQSIPWHNLPATVAVFSDAMLWSGNSEIAQEALNELTGRYAAQWGVVVDPETFSVSVDPGFDAVAAQGVPVVIARKTTHMAGPARMAL
ncbi:hypothetical protein ACFYTS_35660 [Nocardia sp. NPDC004151]|uniref:hypothetical protein n=1 Tax=Nocardia sp. NPDC004151 TaxID=3364304 RepID=UPI0036AE59F0